MQLYRFHSIAQVPIYPTSEEVTDNPHEVIFRFTVYNFYTIGQKHGRVMLDISPCNWIFRLQLDFLISPEWRCGDVLLEIFVSIHSLHFLFYRAETWYDNTRHYCEQRLGTGLSGGAVKACPGKYTY